MSYATRLLGIVIFEPKNNVGMGSGFRNDGVQAPVPDG